MAWTRASSTVHPPGWRRTRAVVLTRDGGRCRWPLAASECGSTDRVEVDRRVPYSQGGSSTPDNAWTLCHEHHVVKTGREATAAREQRTRREPLMHPSRRRHQPKESDDG